MLVIQTDLYSPLPRKPNNPYMLCSLYFGIIYSSSGATFSRSFIAWDTRSSLAKQCSRGETYSTFSALFLTSVQSYTSLRSLQQKSLCWKQSLQPDVCFLCYVFAHIYTWLLNRVQCFLLFLGNTICLPIIWGITAPGLAVMDYEEMRNLKRGSLNKQRETLTGKWSNFSDNPATPLLRKHG